MLLFAASPPELDALNPQLRCFVCVIAALLLAYIVHRFTMRRFETALTVLFQKRLAERARLARDLNDTLLQTIEASKLIADDALDLSADPARMREAMDRLSYWLGQATQEGQAALNSLRAASCDGNDLASSFRRAAEECLTHRSVAIALSVTGESVDMHPIVRDEVYRLGYDAIDRICKYSGTSRLDIALTYGANFCLQVRSSGQPLTLTNTEVKKDTLNLYEMQERAQRFGATLNLTTSTDLTVELTLTVPGGIVFQGAPSVIARWLLNWRKRLLRRGNST
jgi:signal transduction histidine kinase